MAFGRITGAFPYNCRAEPHSGKQVSTTQADDASMAGRYRAAAQAATMLLLDPKKYD
jgi:hypothetical protein